MADPTTHRFADVDQAGRAMTMADALSMLSADVAPAVNRGVQDYHRREGGEYIPDAPADGGGAPAPAPVDTQSHTPAPGQPAQPQGAPETPAPDAATAALQAQIETLTRTVQSLIPPPPDPMDAVRQQVAAVEADLAALAEETGIPADKLAKIVQGITDVTLASRQAPEVARAQAEQRFYGTHRDAQGHEAEMFAVLDKYPAVGQVMAADWQAGRYEQALTYLYTHWKAQQNAPAVQAALANAAATREEIDAAKVHAGVANGGLTRSGSDTAGGEGLTPDFIEATRLELGGNPTAFASRILNRAGVIPAGMFDGIRGI